MNTNVLYPSIFQNKIPLNYGKLQAVTVINLTGKAESCIGYTPIKQVTNTFAEKGQVPSYTTAFETILRCVEAIHNHSGNHDNNAHRR